MTNLQHPDRQTTHPTDKPQPSYYEIGALGAELGAAGVDFDLVADALVAAYRAERLSLETGAWFLLHFVAGQEDV